MLAILALLLAAAGAGCGGGSDAEPSNSASASPSSGDATSGSATGTTTSPDASGGDSSSPTTSTTSGSSESSAESIPQWRTIPDEVDSGFRLDEHAFSFENFGGDFLGRGLSAEVAAEMFGVDAVCVGATSPCNPTPAAEAWIRSANETLDAGRSEGLAAAALLFFLGELDPVEFGAEDAAGLRLHNNFGLQSLVARLASAQRVPSMVASQQGMDAREALVFLADTLGAGAEEGWRLGMAIREEGGFRAGHALVPIGYYRVTGRASYILRVYDPNFPQAEGWVHFDLLANTWRYDGTATPEVPVIYEGTPENGNLLYLAPVTPRMETLDAPFATGSGALQVSSVGELRVLADLGGGVRGGFGEDGLVEEGGVRVLPDFSACPCSDGLLRNSTVHAPAGDGSEDTTVEVSGNGSVFIGGSDYTARVDVPSGSGEAGGGTLKVSADGRSATYTASDRVSGWSTESTVITLVVPTENGPMTVSVAVHPEADVTVSADEQGRVSLDVSGAPQNSRVSVTVVEVAPDGSTRTTSVNTQSDESGGGELAFEPGTGIYSGPIAPGPCENGVRDGDETDVDCGGTGCFARCEEGLRCLQTSDCVDGLLCGGMGRCVEEGCSDGLRNQGETDVDCGGPCSPCEEGQGCAVDADCQSTMRCDEGSSTCVWNERVRARLVGGRLAGDTVTLRATVDGHERSIVLSGIEGDESARGDLGVGKNWHSPQVTQAPAGASCRPISGGSGDWRTVLLVECTWNNTLLRHGHGNLGQDWCALGENQAVMVRLRTESETVEVPALGTLPPLPFTEFYAVEIASRPAPTWFEDRDEWALQSCSPDNQSGSRAIGEVFRDYTMNCSCLTCDRSEDECMSWARELGHLPQLPEGELCLDDADCLSNNCECGAESGYCISELGRCAGPRHISVTPWNENADSPGTFTVPAGCPGVYVQAWGGAGGPWYDASEGSGRGGAGAMARGTLGVLEGEVLTFGVGTGGTTVGLSALPGLGRVVDGFVRGGLGVSNAEGTRRGGNGGGATFVQLENQSIPGFSVPGGAGGSSGNAWAMPGGYPDSGGHDGNDGQDADPTPGLGGGGSGVPGGLGATTDEPIAGGGGWGPLPPGFEALHAEEETWYLPPGRESRDYEACMSALQSGPDPGRSGQATHEQRGGFAGPGCVAIRCIHPDRFDGPLPGGALCTDHASCRTEWCECGPDSGNCEGDSGLCSIPPDPDGSACRIHLDCRSSWCDCGLSSGDCAGDSGVCAPAPEPGSTRTVCTTDTNCTAGNCECGAFSGNCIGDTGYCGEAIAVIREPTADGIADSGTFTVPDACPRVFLSAWGAAGGASYDDFEFERIAGGAGGHVEGYLTVEAGDLIEIWVGEGGHSGDQDPPERAAGSRFGTPAPGGLGEVLAFNYGGGGGGGLTSLRMSGSAAVEFTVPAGGGSSSWAWETLAGAGIEPAGGNDGPGGGDAEEFSDGGAGGGAGEPGGLGATADYEEAEGGAFGTVPDGLVAYSADEGWAAAPARDGTVNYVRCNDGGRDATGAGNDFGQGGHGCVVIRCAAWTAEELAGAGGAP